MNLMDKATIKEVIEIFETTSPEEFRDWLYGNGESEQTNNIIKLPFDEIPNTEKKDKIIELTDEFNDILNILKNTNESVFITGKAGTGKSTLFNSFIKKLDKSMVVLAPTGVAALNVRGQTIHSFFKLPPTVFNPTQIKEDKNRERVLRNLDMMVIDEVSMVRSDLMHGIDMIMRIDRSLSNKENMSKPFGGVQMVFIGDLFQLPPVVPRNVESELYSTFVGPHFFDAPTFSQGFKYHFKELSKIFRQSEDEKRFKEILNKVRIGKVSNADLEELNKTTVYKERNKDSIYLTTRKDLAKNINERELNALTTKEYIFKGGVTGKYTKLLQKTAEQIDNALPVPYNLKLKVGAKIMMVKNDKSGRWVNGSVGTIKSIKEKTSRLFDAYIIVDIDGTEHYVNTVTWEEIRNVADSEGNITQQKIASYTQFPIKIAYAITIHKSQGKTFNNVHIDLGGGAFAPGQLYVALSRCTTLQGITLENKIRTRDAITDDSVVNFYQEKRLN